MQKLMEEAFNALADEGVAMNDTLTIEPNAYCISVKWTGRWPNLCSGKWGIVINGHDVVLPDGLETSPMNTKGSYQTWHFDKNWDEIWETYEDGLDFEEWLKENSWVDDLNLPSDKQRELYDKIAEQDWRHGSCGGCI